MMKITNKCILLAIYLAAAASAVEEEKLPLRRLRQQTLHIPDLFEMSADKAGKNDWYDAKVSSSTSRTHLMNRRNTARQQISEMDVFARLLQSDSSLSLSMPVTPKPPPTPPVVAPTPKAPTPPAPVITPPTPTVVAPTPKAPTVVAPTPKAPTVIAPAPAPVVTSCPVYPVCASLGLTGECCPTVEGIFLDCCLGIVPAPMSSPVAAPSVPGTIEPAPTVPTVPQTPVVPPTPTSKNKEGSMSTGSMSGGSMSTVTSPTSSGSMGSGSKGRA